jgi:hypothetical protein
MLHPFYVGRRLGTDGYPDDQLILDHHASYTRQVAGHAKGHAKKHWHKRQQRCDGH